jgi:glutamine synthetase type III
MPEFFQTRMGHDYYDGTMPKIATALERIATALEIQAEQRAMDDTVTGVLKDLRAQLNELVFWEGGNEDEWRRLGCPRLGQLIGKRTP